MTVPETPVPPVDPRPSWDRHGECAHCQHRPARAGTVMPGVGTASISPPTSRQQPMAAQKA